MIKKRKQKTSKQKKEIKLWELCKEYIRLRDNNTCQKCGKKVHGQGADTSHVFCKARYKGIKYDEINLKVLCMYCHKWWHNNPIESAEWFSIAFPERYESLMHIKEKIKPLKECVIDDYISDYEDKINNFKSGNLEKSRPY
jgi:hypothetical protein